MSRGGIIIRLIDVVLILLFGFVSISEISRKSQIQLPKSQETPLSNPDKEEIIIIGITTDGKYLVDEETGVIQNIETLRNYLIKKNNEFLNKKSLMRVRIRSNWDAPVRYTLALANICDQLNIPKGVDVRRRSR